MLKQVAVALIAASIFAGPVLARTPSVVAHKAPIVKIVTPAKTVKHVKFVGHHKRHVRHARAFGHKPILVVRHTKSLKIGHSHTRVHVAAKPAVRVN